MSARKPGTVAVTAAPATTTVATTTAATTTTAAAADADVEAVRAGAKPDNNNVAEIETFQGDEATSGDVGTTVAAATAAGATTSDEAEQRSDKHRDAAKDGKDSGDKFCPAPSPLITECGSPRKNYSDASSGGKIIRVTRHSSPLLLPNSSTGGGGGGGVSDGDELPSGSQRKSSVDRQSLIRGRKSIKDLRDVKEAAAKLLDEINLKDGTLEMDSEGTITILPEQYVKDQKDAKDTKDNVKSTLDVKPTDRDKDLKEKDKEKEKEKERTPTPVPVTAPAPAPILQPTTPAITCNRVTRKAHAQELALANNNNTRVTRNRRQSSTVNNEPQLPARGRRKRPAPPDPKEALKRKRSDDDSELALKYGKVEVKVEEEDDHESSVVDEPATPAKPTDSIKLELPDGEDQITVASLASPAGAATPTTTTATATPTTQSSNRRGRGRPQTKVTPSSINTTSTRATRHSKAGSPGLLTATPTEPTVSKRRRVGSANRSLLVTKATSASSSSLAASSHGGAAADEDSKDSLASSSMDDLLLAAAEIKQEKLTPDFEESLDGVTITNKPEIPETVEQPNDSAEDAASSNGIEPLTVDTDTDTCKPPGDLLDQVEDEAEAAAVKDPAPEGERDGDQEAEGGAESNEAGKAPSLSPEMISEGVSAISVKQFYKKPEFLANNLGIEKDPELGEIVQIATETTAVNEEALMETETETDLATDVEIEIEMEGGDVETKLEDSYSTGMGELRVDESGDELDSDLTAEKVVEESGEVSEDVATAAGAATATVEEALGSPGELNGETDLPSKTIDDYDDFESEIMEQLAKEGVVDASGNALSASKQSQEETQQLAEMECGTVDKQVEDPTQKEMQEQEVEETEQELTKKKLMTESGNEMVVTLEVEPFTEEQEAEANAVADDDEEDEGVDDAEVPILNEVCTEYPEENKENMSTTSTSDGGIAITVVTVSDDSSAMDIDLAIDIKAEDNVAAKLECVKEEPAKNQEDQDEKPLAAIAAEQKTTALPNLLASKTEANGHGNVKLKPQFQDIQEEELRRQKEFHLQNLGLLTHQAAEQLRQEYIQEAHTRAVHQQQMQQQQQHQTGKRSTAKGGPGGSASHIESSGTLKTVIKLNRSSNGGAGGASGVPTGTVIHGGHAGNAGVTTSNLGMGSATRKGGGIGGAGGAAGGSGGSSAHGVRRQSLKMTFQKGRARGHGAADRAADQHGAHGAEDSYYTIQNENEGATKSKSNLNSGNTGHGRKTNNRFSFTNHNNSSSSQKQQQQQLAQHQQQQQHNQQNNNATRNCLDSSHSEGHGGQMDHGFYQMVKKDEKEKILIPEKASSFKFHPGRLCEDQCYYCSGKFGLYDTPCHVGQIKSVERQQKILANEEKLTVDNCLCDACFRHVDRRANAPSYKKRISAPGHLETSNNNNNAGNSMDKPFGGGDAGGDGEFATTSSGVVSGSGTTAQRACAVKDCADGASHSLRRKCVRKSVKKCLLNFEIPVGTSNVWLCEPHYNTVIQSSGCVLCKRRLGKNHMYHITSDTDRLEKALAEMGIPVQLGVGTAVCKLCRYFANLLMKPPDSTKSQKAEFVKNYRKRLLKVHNLQDGSNEASEADEEDVRAAKISTEAGGEGDGGGGGAHTTSSAAACDEASTELPMPMVVDYNGPTDSNSSSSSTTTTAMGHGSSSSKQISKLQAILQQNLSGETTAAVVNSKSSSNANSNSSSSSNGKGGSKAEADISNVLRGNPNISMRELFHGEEDLGVQFKVPFGCSSSQRTPEGWTRVQTFLQYDEPTRRLWEELQKPYGNQSSFLRHLILLEKYYRNGDLVLAPHASPNASVYTQTVRQRLNSFDHGHCGGLQAAGNLQATTNASSLSPNAAHANAQSNANANASCSSSSSSCSPHAQTPVNVNLSAASASGSSGSGSGVVSVLANALTTPLGSAEQQQQSASQAEAVIPLVELNDDDDDDDDALEDKEDVSYYLPPELGIMSLDRLRNVSVDKLTKQLSSNAVTIIARPKDKQTAIGNGGGSGSGSGSGATATVLNEESQQKLSKDAPPLVPTSGANSRSILKTNLLNKAVEIVPLASQQQQQHLHQLQQQQQQQQQSNNKPASVSGDKPNKLLDMANKLASVDVALLSLQQQALAHTHTQAQKQKALTTAPTILQQQQQQQQSAKPVQNVAQLLNSSPPELISLQRRRTSGASGASGGAAATVTATVPSLAGKRLQLPRTGSGAGAAGSVGSAAAAAPKVIKLPDSLSPQERQDSKSWKPTLIPLKEQHRVPNKSSQTLFQTADGRRLPAQVQVQSGGKPYLISITDYNRMCILRREKLMRDQMLKANAKLKPGQAQTQSQQQQQQHSNYSAGLSNLSKMTAAQQTAAAQTARHQLQQLQQQQQQQHKQQQQQQLPTLPTLQPGGGGASSGLRLARLAPKPMPPLSNPQQNASGGSAAAQSSNYQPMLVNALAAAAAASAAAAANSSSVTLDNNSSWLWQNFPDANQLLLNGNGSRGSSAVAGKLPHLTAKPAATATSGGGGGGITFTLKQQQQQQQQQKLIDNVIMSKIPKSLTVIPQHMGGGGGGGGGDVTGGGAKE